MVLTQQQRNSFREHGFLVLRDMLSAEETQDLQQWAQEVHDWPTDPSSGWMPYEEINARGERVLCRTENYAAYHSGFNHLLRGSKLRNVLKQLAGEDVNLFKEKINYKLAGSGGFAAHVDSTAYTHIKNVKHITILLAVDRCGTGNGGLEVVDGSHEMSVPIGADNCIPKAWVGQQTWTPVELEAGELLVFGSYLAHRSGANTSTRDRKALYATYNRASEGDLHDPYYVRRRKEWPPMQDRKQGDDYYDVNSEGALRYGYGSPMLSMALGKQLQV